MMTVKTLHIKPVKKGAAKTLEKMNLIEDFGPEGDAYGGPGERQITLLGEEDIKDLEKDREKGLCIHRFTSNIVLSGSTSSLRKGETYHLGESMIRITGEKKRCFPECSIVTEEKRICILPDCARFAAVVQSGKIATGDIFEK